MKKIFRGFRAILYKEFIVVFRDRTALFFMFFPPLVQIIAFGFALDMDVRNMPTALLNQDRTLESRQLIDEFVNTETFRIVKVVDSPEELAATIRRGEAYLGIQIPPDFARDLRARHAAYVQVLIDGSSSTTALQALNTGINVTFNDSLRQLVKESGRSGIPIEVRPQVLYNPALKSPNFFVPGVFFSGFIFPRETMPWIFSAIGACMPVTYFITLMRAIVLRGASLAEFWSSLVVLAAMGAALFSLCAVRFRKKLG